MDAGAGSGSGRARRHARCGMLATQQALVLDSCDAHHRCDSNIPIAAGAGGTCCPRPSSPNSDATRLAPVTGLPRVPYVL